MPAKQLRLPQQLRLTKLGSNPHPERIHRSRAHQERLSQSRASKIAPTMTFNATPRLNSHHSRAHQERLSKSCKQKSTHNDIQCFATPRRAYSGFLRNPFALEMRPFMFWSFPRASCAFAYFEASYAKKPRCLRSLGKRIKSLGEKSQA